MKIEASNFPRFMQASNKKFKNRNPGGKICAIINRSFNGLNEKEKWTCIQLKDHRDLFRSVASETGKYLEHTHTDLTRRHNNRMIEV